MSLEVLPRTANGRSFASAPHFTTTVQGADAELYDWEFNDGTKLQVKLEEHSCEFLLLAKRLLALLLFLSRSALLYLSPPLHVIAATLQNIPLTLSPSTPNSHQPLDHLLCRLRRALAHLLVRRLQD